MDSDKLQQYVLLAKGARGRAAADLISKATSDPAIFGFAELLECQSIQDLRNGDFASHLDLLQLYAYGTWPEYKVRAASLPPISDAQILKLKQLTVVSLALTEKVISYEKLQQQLEIPTLRELEDFLITQCFYASIVKAKLDQKNRSLQVQNVIGRDVRPEDLPDVTNKLNTWIGSCEGVLKAIEQRITASTVAVEEAKTRRADLEAKQEEVRKSIKVQQVDLRSAENMLLDDSFDMMDEDRTEREMGRMERGERVRPKSRRR